AAETRALGRRAAPLFVFLVALAMRLSLLEEHPIDAYLVGDMAFYDARARHLLSDHQAIWDTFTPVGYPAVIALFHAIFAKSYDAIGYAQALLGAATCSLTHAITLRLTRGTWASLAAGFCLALYLPAIVYVGFLMTETLFAF